MSECERWRRAGCSRAARQGLPQTLLHADAPASWHSLKNRTNFVEVLVVT